MGDIGKNDINKLVEVFCGVVKGIEDDLPKGISLEVETVGKNPFFYEAAVFVKVRKEGTMYGLSAYFSKTGKLKLGATSGYEWRGIVEEALSFQTSMRHPEYKMVQNNGKLISNASGWPVVVIGGTLPNNLSGDLKSVIGELINPTDLSTLELVPCRLRPL